MAKTPDITTTSMIAEILRRIDRGDDTRSLARDASRIAARISPAELAAAKRSLLNEGYAPTIADHLCDAFVLMRRYEQQASSPQEPPADMHILQKVTAEHGVFRCLAAELSEAVADLGSMECVSDMASEYRRLIHVLEHLQAMKEHFEREDDVILPYLRRLGWANLCATAGDDHARLRAHIDSLTSLVTSIHAFRRADFQATLAAGVGRFRACLLEHLAFEDGLLWPIALLVIDDSTLWRTMNALCEEIGYCGIHVT